MKENKIEMIAFAGYLYPHNKACLVCEHFYENKQASFIVHDSDGWIQVLCGEIDHNPKNAKTVALSEIIDSLPDKESLAVLHPGHYAECQNTIEWKVSSFK